MYNIQNKYMNLYVKEYFVNFEEVMGRVALIIEHDLERKPYDKDIADALGIAATQYSNNKKRQNIPFEKIAELCARKRISINWVLYEQSSQMLDKNTEDIFKVRILIDVNGSAGGGAFNDENEEDFTYLSLDRFYTDMIGIKEGDNIEAIKVIGDSMETTIKDNSIVLVDRNKTDITNGGIFVINTKNGVLVKRVTLSLSGGISLISDNKNYPIETVSADEAMIIGKVIGALERI